MVSKPKRPYLLRALYDWIVESDLTPYLLVGVDSDSIQVPRDYVSDGKIVLNISPVAVRDLLLGEHEVTFSGRFSGRAFPVVVPLSNVMAIYAKETGEGMMFEPEEAYSGGPDDTPPEDGTSGPPARSGGSEGGSHLKVVK